MDSSTKVKIQREKVIELVKVNFGESSLVSSVEELDGGMMNSAFLIELENAIEGEKELILKISFTPDIEILAYEKEIMRAEVEFYKYLEGKEIPVPRLFKNDFTHTLIDCDYFFMSKIEGTIWKDLIEQISEIDKENLKKELGRYNAVIHSVKGSYFGYIKADEKWHYEKWSDAYLFMLKTLIEDGKDRNVDLPYEQILQVAQGSRELLDEIKTPALVNFDMWAGNIFLKKQRDSYTISGIIDFERSFFGDPYADFIASMMVYDDVEKEKSFQEGYSGFTGKRFEVTENDRLRMDLYRIYMSLILGIETYRFDQAYAGQVLDYVKSQISSCLKHFV